MPGRLLNKELDSLIVRPILEEEKDRWNHLVKTHHYLHSRRLVGETVRYVAILNNEWVALLGWNTGSFRLAARDRWIGWSDKHRIERFKYTVNNSRFLILPWVRIKNLASKTLALNMRRIIRDWIRVYGHPVLLAETFVDPTLYKGTCYRAAGFIPVGKSKGYGLSAGNYYYHGRKKLIFVYPLCKHARKWLKDPFPAPFLLEGQEQTPLVDLNRMELLGEDSLLEYLREIPDWRHPKGRRHELALVLSFVVCALLLDIEGRFSDIARWVKELPWGIKKELGCRRYIGPPSEPIIRRTMQTVDVDLLCQKTACWLNRHQKGRVVEEISSRLRLLSNRRNQPRKGAERS